MVVKESLHLGQKVLVGENRLNGVVDGLTQTFVGVIVDGQGLMLLEYNEIWEA